MIRYVNLRMWNVRARKVNACTLSHVKTLTFEYYDRHSTSFPFHQFASPNLRSKQSIRNCARGRYKSVSTACLRESRSNNVKIALLNCTLKTAKSQESESVRTHHYETTIYMDHFIDLREHGPKPAHRPSRSNNLHRPSKAIWKSRKINPVSYTPTTNRRSTHMIWSILKI